MASAPAPITGLVAGRVLFVGAGPGDPALLTLRALECLRQADVVVHDVLVPAAVLDAAGTHAERVPVPRAPSDAADPGIAVGRLLVDLVRKHRVVVRLKGGDPGVFARLAEEQQPLLEAGVPWEIVPGVTAAMAAAAVAGVPLTSRAAASSVTLLTGHEADDKGSTLDFESLARLPGTLVVYMGVEQVATWSRALIKAGRRGDTPVTLVSRCSWPDQRTCFTTLADCGSELDRRGWTAPAIVIIGEVAGQSAAAPDNPARGDALRRPLSGSTVLITRPAGQGGELSALVAAHGGSSVHLPLIRIGPPESWAPLDAAIEMADSFDWIVFASANGVRSFAERLRIAGRDVRHLGTARVATIGQATAREAALLGIPSDLVPDDQRSEGIVAALGDGPRQARFLLVRASRGRDVMRRGLVALGHHVTEVAAYSSFGVDEIDQEMLAELERDIDWITVTSSFIAESACRLFGDRLKRWKVASLSPVTTATLAAAGVTPTVEAVQPSTAALVAAIAGWEAAHRDLAHPSGSVKLSTAPAAAAGRPVDSGTRSSR